ncbi:ATP synthase subunit I [Dasania marina]|uniref:ATP synthase subunit I n=1 Tax=Dasania marina TaxID=471499 RepID=UPI0030D7FCD4|tara:strand:+ start:2746 stop:3060 length:315 start_codon:yes stop_codon:yes gene_type:complete
MMNEIVNLAASLFAGVVLGGFFFGGLWWTVQKAVASEHAAFWFLGSLMLRTAVVLLGFYFLMAGGWQHMLAALLGLFVARLIVMRLTRATRQSSALVQDIPHEP